MAFGDNSRQVQSSTQGRATTFRNMGGFVNGGTGSMLTRVEASEGDQLADIGKAGHETEFSQEFASGQVADTGNGSQQVALTLEVRMLVDMVLNGLLGLGDVGLQQIQLGLQLSRHRT